MSKNHRSVQSKKISAGSEKEIVQHQFNLPQHQKQKRERHRQAPPIKTFETGTLKPSQFSVEADTIWKDVVHHEKRLIKLWAWKWDFLVSNEKELESLRQQNRDRTLRDTRRTDSASSDDTSNAVKIPNRPQFPEIFMDKALATRQCNRDIQNAVLRRHRSGSNQAEAGVPLELPEPKQEKARKVAEISETLFQIKERDRGHPKQPPPSKTSQFVVPLTSAGEIGWRLPKPKGARTAPEKNSFDLYPTIGLLHRVPKLCFVREQYGGYRKLKYLRQHQQQQRQTQAKDTDQTNHAVTAVVSTGDGTSETSTLPLSLPSKAIRHVVNPLLC